MKNIKIITGVLLLGILLSTSCKKKFENPPPKTAPANTGNISIDSIFKIFVAHYVVIPTPATQLYKFNSDVNLLCTVTADEITLNIMNKTKLDEIVKVVNDILFDRN